VGRLSLFLFLLGQIAIASGARDCAATAGKFVVTLDRERFLVKRDYYQLSLEFKPNQSGFAYGVNWLRPKDVTLNQENLVEQWTERDSQKTGICQGAITPEKCLRRLGEAALYLSTSKKIILRDQPQYKDKLDAIECAESRLAAYTASVKHHIRLR
jgi:hypothetical protein